MSSGAHTHHHIAQTRRSIAPAALLLAGLAATYNSHSVAHSSVATPAPRAASEPPNPSWNDLHGGRP